MKLCFNRITNGSVSISLVITLMIYIFICEDLAGQIHPVVQISNLDGKTLPSNAFVKGDNLEEKPINKYNGVNLQIGLSSTSHKSWASVYRQPYFGIGVALHDFGSRELGNPVSGYGFLGIPIIRTKYLSLINEIQYGMAFGWNFYDSVKNPKNHAIGSNITVHAANQLMLRAHVSPYIDITGGVSFVHFSNGRFERPNNGINIYSPSIGLSIYPNKKAKVEKREITLPRVHEWSLIAGYGNHQRNENIDDENYFAIAGMSAGYGRMHNNYYRSRIGMDLNYFWSMTVNDDGTQATPGWENLTIGAFYQPEFVIGRFTMLGGIGLYLRHANYNNYKQLYQRLGLRYNFTKKMSAAVNIRSVNFYEAEFLEFQFGYHIWK